MHKKHDKNGRLVITLTPSDIDDRELPQLKDKILAAIKNDDAMEVDIDLSEVPYEAIRINIARNPDNGFLATLLYCVNDRNTGRTMTVLVPRKSDFRELFDRPMVSKLMNIEYTDKKTASGTISSLSR